MLIKPSRQEKYQNKPDNTADDSKLVVRSEEASGRRPERANDRLAGKHRPVGAIRIESGRPERSLLSSTNNQ